MRAFLSALVLTVVLLVPSAVHAEIFEKADEVKQHLEFLGYTIEEQPDHDRILAKHQRHFNVAVRSFSGGLLLSTFLNMNSPLGADRERVLEIINKLNANAAVVRHYLDGDEDFATEAWFAGAYEKTNFGVFIENYNSDMSRLSDLSAEEKAFFK